MENSRCEICDRDYRGIRNSVRLLTGDYFHEYFSLCLECSLYVKEAVEWAREERLTETEKTIPFDEDTCGFCGNHNDGEGRGYFECLLFPGDEVYLRKYRNFCERCGKLVLRALRAREARPFSPWDGKI